MLAATTSHPVTPAATTEHLSADVLGRAVGRARPPIAAASGDRIGGVVEAGTATAGPANVVAADIAAFVHHPVGSVSLGRRVADTVNTLLLASGWAFTGLVESPLSLQSGPTSGSAGDGWAAWRQDGDGAHELLAEDGLWRALGGIDIDTTPKGAEELAGTYRHLDAASAGWSTITRHTSLTFAADGTFSRARLTTVAGGGIATPHAPAAVSTWTLDAPELVAPAGGDTANVVLADAARDGHLFGTYHALEDGVTVELRYVNGHVERRLLFAAGEDRHVLGTRTTARDASAIRHALYGPPTREDGGGWLTALGGVPDKDGERREREDDRRHIRRAIEKMASLGDGEPAARVPDTLGRGQPP